MSFQSTRFSVKAEFCSITFFWCMFLDPMLKISAYISFIKLWTITTFWSIQWKFNTKSKDVSMNNLNWWQRTNHVSCILCILFKKWLFVVNLLRKCLEYNLFGFKVRSPMKEVEEVVLSDYYMYPFVNSF